MLVSLRIENFALIDRLELDFAPGLNVLTGETGAGKSIILDALSAALGVKVSSRTVRTGTDRALVEATFESTLALLEWLAEADIDPVDGNAIVVSREMTCRNGSLRTRSRVNGIVVNRQVVDGLRDRLIEIAAQGQTVELGQASRQLEWLDNYGGTAVQQCLGQVATACDRYQQAVRTLEERRGSEQQRLQRLDMWQYQLQELQEGQLDAPDELERLEGERRRLSHVVELQKQSYQLTQLLHQNDADAPAAVDLLGQAEDILQDMRQYDPRVQGALDMVADALTSVMEAGRTMSRYGEELEADPEALQQVEERIVLLKQVCRKYGPTLAEAIAYRDKIQKEISEAESTEQSLEALETARDEALDTLERHCQALTQLRQQAARQLETELVQALKPLAMEKVQFQVAIAPTSPSSKGADRIAFLFSPNPGEPLQPLKDTASGGEMSRFLLALKACFARDRSSQPGKGRAVKQKTPATQALQKKVLVFDEIDAGVSGRVAQAIAENLYQLSHRHQVLCVTHQPLVAAMADRHFRVDKQVLAQEVARSATSTTTDDATALRTVVRVAALSHSQRRDELAQLTGGTSASEAIAFAESLLAKADSVRHQSTAS